MTWDEYFLRICLTVAQNSKCLSRQIGAIIVKERSIISTGYNGAPSGIPHCGVDRYNADEVLRKELRKTNINFLYAPDHILNVEKSRFSSLLNSNCPRKLMDYKSGEGLHMCPAAHAERNALLNAARRGISTDGCVLYMSCPIPCGECMKEIINAGISEIVFTEWKYYDEMSKFLLKESDLRARTYGENIGEVSKS